MFRATSCRRRDIRGLLLFTHLHSPVPKSIQLHLQPIKFLIPGVVLVMWYTPSHRCGDGQK